MKTASRACSAVGTKRIVASSTVYSRIDARTTGSALSASSGLSLLPSFARRQKRLRDGFAEALDMLVICVEAGLGLTGAIARVADELKYSRPELAAELDIVNAEMRTGVDREVALENLNARTGLVEIRGLVSLLVQTLRFGTGVADSLRVYSSEFRDQRMQAAEERAGKIGTKLIFPLIFCEFPAFFLIAVGPAALLLMESFGR